MPQMSPMSWMVLNIMMMFGFFLLNLFVLPGPTLTCISYLNLLNATWKW